MNTKSSRNICHRLQKWKYWG